MNKKKTIIAAAILLAVCAIGGAVAYFTDTETKTNTFTIGNVDITLTETAWDDTDANSNNIPDAAENVTHEDTIAKNPVITNVSSSAPAYVFAKVEIPCATVTDNSTNPATVTTEEIFSLGTIGTGWTLMTNGTCTENATTHKYVATKIYNYGTDSAMTSLAASAATPALFSNVTLNASIDGSESGLSGAQDIVVTGYGIQTKNIATPAAPATVWSNF